MFAIVKKNLIFSKTNEINDLKAIKIQASPYPQPLEDWISETLLFELCASDGTIEIFEKPVQISAQTEQKIEEKEDKKKK